MQVEGKMKKRKAGELVNHLRGLLKNPDTDPASCLGKPGSVLIRFKVSLLSR